MSRAPRTTKKQKEFIINYLEDNRIPCGRKINPIALPQINKLWLELANELNQIGPAKPIKQWKDTISEMKTNVKRRARDIKFGHVGTGGGDAVKPLSEMEERLLALVSILTVEGTPGLPEAGGPSTSEAILTDVYLTEPQEIRILTESDVVMESNVVMESHILDKSGLETDCRGEEDNTKKPTKRVAFRKRKRNNRVKTALETHDQHLINLSRSNYAIAKSIAMLARSIYRIAQKM